jgi:hypothetical protein
MMMCLGYQSGRGVGIDHQQGQADVEQEPEWRSDHTSLRLSTLPTRGRQGRDEHDTECARLGIITMGEISSIRARYSNIVQGGASQERKVEYDQSQSILPAALQPSFSKRSLPSWTLSLIAESSESESGEQNASNSQRLTTIAMRLSS